MASVFALQIKHVYAEFSYPWVSGQYMRLHNRYDGPGTPDWPMGCDSLHEAAFFPNYASALKAYDTYELNKRGSFLIIQLDVVPTALHAKENENP